MSLNPSPMNKHRILVAAIVCASPWYLASVLRRGQHHLPFAYDKCRAVTDMIDKPRSNIRCLSR